MDMKKHKHHNHNKVRRNLMVRAENMIHPFSTKSLYHSLTNLNDSFLCLCNIVSYIFLSTWWIDHNTINYMFKCYVVIFQGVESLGDVIQQTGTATNGISAEISEDSEPVHLEKNQTLNSLPSLTVAFSGRKIKWNPHFPSFMVPDFHPTFPLANNHSEPGCLQGLKISSF